MAGRRAAAVARLLACAPWLGLLWGFAEGTVFFIVPDVLISLVALFSWRRSLVCTATALLGSLLGGTLMYCAAIARPDLALAVVRSVPFVMPKMVAAVQADYARLGVWALLQGPISGIPYKLYAVAAPARMFYAPFLLVSVPARLGRFLLAAGTWFLAGALARRLKWINPAYFLAAHIAIWCVLYAFYWTDALRP